MHLAAACNITLAPRDQSLRLASPARAYYRYAQICAVGCEKEAVKLMRRIILLITVAMLVVISTLFVVSASGANKNPTAKAQKQTTKTVLIQNFRFKPAQITIKRGMKVRWINKDSHPHTATAINGKSFDSGRLGKGQSYTHTFKSAGTKKYLCEIHPFMRGSVVVKR
jgi:plastocyanin